MDRDKEYVIFPAGETQARTAAMRLAMSEFVVQADRVTITAADRFEGPHGIGYNVRVRVT